MGWNDYWIWWVVNMDDIDMKIKICMMMIIFFLWGWGVGWVGGGEGC